MSEPRERVSYEEYAAIPDWLSQDGRLICSTWCDHVDLLVVADTPAVGLDIPAVDRLIAQLTAWRAKCTEG